MNDEAYAGLGTGLCNSDKTYLSAKEALTNLEGSYPGVIEKLCQDEEFASVKARYENWAAACNDSKPYEGKAIVSNANDILGSINNTGTIASVSLVCLFGISTGIGAILLRKRKHN